MPLEPPLAALASSGRPRPSNALSRLPARRKAHIQAVLSRPMPSAKLPRRRARVAFASRLRTLALVPRRQVSRDADRLGEMARRIERYQTGGDAQCLVDATDAAERAQQATLLARAPWTPMLGSRCSGAALMRA